MKEFTEEWAKDNSIFAGIDPGKRDGDCTVTILMKQDANGIFSIVEEVVARN